MTAATGIDAMVHAIGFYNTNTKIMHSKHHVAEKNKSVAIYAFLRYILNSNFDLCKEFTLFISVKLTLCNSDTFDQSLYWTIAREVLTDVFPLTCFSAYWTIVLQWSTSHWSDSTQRRSLRSTRKTFCPTCLPRWQCEEAQIQIQMHIYIQRTCSPRWRCEKHKYG